MTIGTFENDVLPEEMKDAFRAAFTTDPDELQRLTMASFRLLVRGDADHLSGGYLGAGEPTYEDASLVASLPPTEAGLQLLARRVEATPSS